MSVDNALSNQTDAGRELCAVCGKSVEGAGGYVRLQHGMAMVALCCPLCLTTFEGNPEHFVGKQASQREVHAIFDLLRPAHEP